MELGLLQAQIGHWEVQALKNGERQDLIVKKFDWMRREGVGILLTYCLCRLCRHDGKLNKNEWFECARGV